MAGRQISERTPSLSCVLNGSLTVQYPVDPTVNLVVDRSRRSVSQVVLSKRESLCD